MKSQLEETDAKVQLLSLQAETFLSELEPTRTDLDLCRSKKNELESNLVTTQTDLGHCREEMEESVSNFHQIRTAYEDVERSYARLQASRVWTWTEILGCTMFFYLFLLHFLDFQWEHLRTTRMVYEGIARQFPSILSEAAKYLPYYLWSVVLWRDLGRGSCPLLSCFLILHDLGGMGDIILVTYLREEVVLKKIRKVNAKDNPINHIEHFERVLSSLFSFFSLFVYLVIYWFIYEVCLFFVFCFFYLVRCSFVD